MANKGTTGIRVEKIIEPIKDRRHFWREGKEITVAMTQTMRKLVKSKPVVERFQLKPGETLVITDLGVSESAP